MSEIIETETDSGTPVTLNGCGPWWMPQSLCFDYFQDQCNVHDKDYWNNKLSRKKADKKFLRTMLYRVNKDEHLTWIQKKARRAQARFFYCTVRIFGFSSHRKGLEG